MFETFLKRAKNFTIVDYGLIKTIFLLLGIIIGTFANGFFRSIILPADKLAAVTDWNNDESDGFEFMEAETVSESTRHEARNGAPHKNIYGWDVSIRRELGKTACSAIKS